MKKTDFIQKTLDSLFPDPPIPLKFESPYTLLIAVLLSAQCTDERVNKVTPLLFSLANTPEKMVTLSHAQIEKIINPCGLSNFKARSILSLSKDLITKFQSQVPNTFEELESLDGVGHKTASVIMAQVFNLPAFPIDTHIHRLAWRWKLSNGKSVIQTEKDLKKAFPKKAWNKLHLQMIYYARTYCPARGHNIDTCPICKALDV